MGGKKRRKLNNISSIASEANMNSFFKFIRHLFCIIIAMLLFGCKERLQNPEDIDYEQLKGIGVLLPDNVILLGFLSCNHDGYFREWLLFSEDGFSCFPQGKLNNSSDILKDTEGMQLVVSAINNRIQKHLKAEYLITPTVFVNGKSFIADHNEAQITTDIVETNMGYYMLLTIIKLKMQW